MGIDIEHVQINSNGGHVKHIGLPQRKALIFVKAAGQMAARRAWGAPTEEQSSYIRTGGITDYAQAAELIEKVHENEDKANGGIRSLYQSYQDEVEAVFADERYQKAIDAIANKLMEYQIPFGPTDWQHQLRGEDAHRIIEEYVMKGEVASRLGLLP